jgi:hypothetical protein
VLKPVRNAVDWSGSYGGVLPCVGCPGTLTRLVLMADRQFELDTQELGRQTSPHTKPGRVLIQVRTE